MLKLGEIRAARGSHQNTKRLGRGSGSGRGGTAGKGHKGQLARSGGKVTRGFEGGQMPLYRRLPKKGFTNIFRTHYAIINVGDLEALGLGEVTIEVLHENKKVRSSLSRLKILGGGELKKSIRVRAHAVSSSAREKIEKAGGTVEVLTK